MYKNGEYFFTPAEWLEGVNEVIRRGMETKEMREVRERAMNNGICLRWDGMEAMDIFRVHTDPFKIDKVIFHNPATVVYWKDGTKTVVTDQDNIVDGKPKPCESYSMETGLALCFMKKALGNSGNFNNAFRKWIQDYEG